jgi:hypothetical protein
MIETVRTKKGQLRSSVLFFFFNFLFSWTAAFLAPLVISFHIFLFFFLLRTSRFLYTPGVLVCALRFLMIFLLYIYEGISFLIVTFWGR